MSYMGSIQLLPWEIFFASQVGCMRQAENLKNNAKPAHGAHDREYDWQRACEGAIGECALAKYLNLYWSGKGRLTDPDVGKMEVRTRPFSHYDLISYDKDLDDQPVWLLTGLNGKYDIRGWLYGREAKLKEYWGEKYVKGRWGFFVPQNKLRTTWIR